MVVNTKTSIIEYEPNILIVGKKMILTDKKILISQNTLAELKGSKGKYNLHYG